MNKLILTGVLSFIAGGGIGVLGTHLYYKKNFDKRIDEEVEEIRSAIEEGYASKPVLKEPEEDPDLMDKVQRARDKGDLFAYARELNENREHENYSKYSKEYKTETEELPEEVEVTPEPVDIEIIAPDEYDTLNYKTMTLYYLRDGVLVDTDGEIIHDVNNLVGYDSLDQFGEYGEPDSVYVRNNTEHLDIAIYQRDETVSTFNN